jgi:hypothetical protein
MSQDAVLREIKAVDSGEKLLHTIDFSLSRSFYVYTCFVHSKKHIPANTMFRCSYRTQEKFVVRWLEDVSGTSKSQPS